MLKVIELIKNNSNWRNILTNAPYCLKIIDEGEFTLLKFAYNGSDFSNEIVRECRGLIIDRGLNPVCVPFFKFFNYGEPFADEIDWDSAVVEEKMDGMLIKVWNYKGSWMISTKDTILAEKAILNSEKRANFKNYNELFMAALEKINFNLNSLSPHHTYVFELVSPHNRLVVPYDTIDVFHIGARENASGQELEIDIGIKKPKTYKCNSIRDINEMTSQLNSCEEGYVVKDKNYKRVKVKNPAYIATKYLVGEILSYNKIVEIIKTNYVMELLVYFPEHKNLFDKIFLMANRITRRQNKSSEWFWSMPTEKIMHYIRNLSHAG